jgi:hypothetical protein
MLPFNPQSKEVTLGQIKSEKLQKFQGKVSGLTVTISRSNIDQYAPKEYHLGIITIYHESFHVLTLLSSSEYWTKAWGETAKQDKQVPNPAEIFGQKVFEEYQKLSEFYNSLNINGLKIVEKMIIEYIEQAQTAMEVMTILLLLPVMQ